MVSRCAEHGGYVVVCHNQNVKKDSFVHERMTLWQDTLLHGLRRMGENKFSFIFAYPEHHVLNAYKQVTPRAWRDARLEMFQHFKRILKPGGFMSMIVDPDVFSTVIYQAILAGLDFEIKKNTFEYFDPEPYSTASFAYADAKAHIILYKDYIDPIPEKGSAILDLTGVKLRHSEKYRKGNKMLTLCTNTYHFERLKKKLIDGEQ